MPRKLYRSRQDHIIAGVAGGLGEFFSVDATLLRLVMLMVVFAGGAGIFFYIMAWVVIPVEPGHNRDSDSSLFSQSEALREQMVKQAKQMEAKLQARKENADKPKPAAEIPEEEEIVGGPPDTSAEDERIRQQRLGGFILVGIGILLVIRNLFPWIDFAGIWPVLIIGLGIVLILRGLVE